MRNLLRPKTLEVSLLGSGTPVRSHSHRQWSRNDGEVRSTIVSSRLSLARSRTNACVRAYARTPASTLGHEWREDDATFRPPSLSPSSITRLSRIATNRPTRQTSAERASPNVNPLTRCPSRRAAVKFTTVGLTSLLRADSTTRSVVPARIFSRLAWLYFLFSFLLARSLFLPSPPQVSFSLGSTRIFDDLREWKRSARPPRARVCVCVQNVRTDAESVARKINSASVHVCVYENPRRSDVSHERASWAR